MIKKRWIIGQPNGDRYTTTSECCPALKHGEMLLDYFEV